MVADINAPRVRPVPNKPIEQRREEKQERDRNIQETLQRQAEKLREQVDRMYDKKRGKD